MSELHTIKKLKSDINFSKTGVVRDCIKKLKNGEYFETDISQPSIYTIASKMNVRIRTRKSPMGTYYVFL